MGHQPKFNRGSDNEKRSQEMLGLDVFQKSLDKVFFSSSTITYESNTDQVFNLIIDLQCNFKLVNALFHPDMGNWGGFHRKRNTLKQPPFERALMKLQDLNDGAVDIAEVYINLLDTSLIISKIHDQSISYQLEAVLLALSQNFVHFTKGLLEMPLEIFIPVFEKKQSNGISGSKSDQQAKAIGGYFDFWGLYFPSKKNQDPLIYDLKNRKFIDEDLELIRLEK